jgi:hypothetical protein
VLDFKTDIIDCPDAAESDAEVFHFKMRHKPYYP